MTGGDTTRYQNVTDEANDLVALLLGTLKLLDEFAVAVTEQAGTIQTGGQDRVADDAPLLAALGLLSLRRTVRRWADYAAGDHPPAPDQRDEAPARLMRMLR